MISSSTKAIEGNSGINNDESISTCANSHTIHGKELSYCYFMNNNHWSDNDEDDDDDDVYEADNECRENKHEREDV
ncbi:MAG: hypothetical protein Q6358_09005 [Candidatus Brocadiales bacterium]|nr:hypothetical protein [Candidatus Brocadiales bacterium]